MNKAIIILNGVSEGKTKFVETAKANGYWVWNLNHLNVLSMITYELGWNGIRTKEYFSFIDDLKILADKYFDFENWYISFMIDKFQNSDKAKLLIIHNCTRDLAYKLQEESYNCFTIDIVNDDIVEENCDYCKILNCKSDDYVDNVLLTLNILTKDFQRSEKMEG
jgi:hypothetical protein